MKKIETFAIGSLSVVGAKSMRKQYERFGYEYVSTEIVNEVIMQTFKDTKK